MTQKYGTEFKLHAVQLASESGKTTAQVAQELGVSQKTLYGWVAKYKEDPSTPFVGSGYYAWCGRPESERAKRRTRITKRVHQIFMKSHRLYGSPKITHILLQEGECVAQKTVAEIMRENQLRSRSSQVCLK